LSRPRIAPLTVISLLAATIANGPGCGDSTRACKSGTLFVTIELEAWAAMATDIEIDISVGTATPKMFRQPHRSGTNIETVEIDFPAGYPTDKVVRVDVTALMSSKDVGSGSTVWTKLPAGCAAATIKIDGHAPSGTAGTGGGGAGRGGSSGAGGSIGARGGTGGSATGGSSGGRGGSAGGAPTTCAMGATNPPGTLVIADFSDATADAQNAGEIRFGATLPLHGGTARFASANKGTLSVSGGALTFAASLETPTAATTYPFSGFVLYVDGPACVNATAYQGVEFTLSNVSVSTQCLILFKATDAAHVAKADDPDRGRCQASGACYAGAYSVSAGTTRIPFAAPPTIAGNPATAVDPGFLTDVQFQFQATGATACSGSFTVDNVRFYGSGGTGGAGGSSGTGGSSAGGSGAGGGSGGTPACTPMPPSQALITNFSEATSGTGGTGNTPPSFGTGPASGGGFIYGVPAPVVSVAGGAAHVTLTASSSASVNYVGFGLAFNSCVNASAYSGVRFTLTGTVTGCTMQFMTTYTEVLPTSDPKGMCSGPTCYPSQTDVTPQAAPRSVAWNAYTRPGVPVATVDAGRLANVVWQFTIPASTACSADVTIDDVQFY
jgi:hypothetical protein